MKTLKLAAKGVKLILKENVLAVISEIPLKSVSSAIHNGGSKETKVIVNTQVTKEYGDSLLHEDPEAFIQLSFTKLGIAEDFVGMVTFANVADFVLESKAEGKLAVSVIATAGCTHGESSGEEITLQKIEGTINIIVVIDGNPTESCLTSIIITATEAKTAALRELDVRSRYTGDEATGTITDALVAAKTGHGPEIAYGGPASQLGQLVGCCTRKAVKDAVMNGKVGGFVPGRSIAERLKERGLSVEKLARELSKVKSLNANQKEIVSTLTNILDNEPLLASVLFAAAEVSEEFEKGRIPQKFGAADALGKKFGELVSQRQIALSKSDNKEANLPPFLKQALIAVVGNALSEKKN